MNFFLFLRVYFMKCVGVGGGGGVVICALPTCAGAQSLIETLGVWLSEIRDGMSMKNKPGPRPFRESKKVNILMRRTVHVTLNAMNTK